MVVRMVKCLIVFVIYSIFPSNIGAQVYGVGASAVRKTSYASDSIYIYNINEKNWEQKGSLKAISIDSTGGWEFVWMFLDYPNDAFLPLKTVSNDSVSLITDLNEGCYRLEMKKDTIDTVFYAWIYLNKLRAHVFKNKKGEVPSALIRCEKIQIKAINTLPEAGKDSSKLFYHTDKFYYKNVSNFRETFLNNKIRCVVSGGGIVTDTIPAATVNIYNAPIIDTSKRTTFIYKLFDAFGNKLTDTVKYKSIHTKADFEVQVADVYMDSLTTFRKEDVVKGEAPLVTRFVNKSKLGYKFEWLLTDSSFVGYYYQWKDSVRRYRADSAHFFTTDSTATIDSLVYQKPFKYKAFLISTGPAPDNCVDTSEVKVIEVEDSQLGASKDEAFPKAFSPNNDGDNDYFYKKDSTDGEVVWKSIRLLNLQIFNQWGKLVYEYQGSILNGWKGWDGKLQNGRDASPGIFYYYYQATGWGPIKKGSAATTGTTTPTGNEAEGPVTKEGAGYVYLFR